MRLSPRSLHDAPLLFLLAAAPAGAQGLDSLVHRIGAMSAVTGLEGAMADTLLSLLPGAQRDRAGNVVLVRGSGSPVRVAECPMDEIGYVVGGINAEGYLTLRRVCGTNVGPLYDQFLEGQRITVYGRRGPVPGVVGVRSTHLTRGRPADNDPPFALDQAYVDVGAATAADVAGLGIQVLSPVTRAKRVHAFGPQAGFVAAPWMAQRAACAALLSAALRAQPSTGTTVVAFTARRHFNNDGRLFVTRAHRGADIVMLGSFAAGAALGSGPAVARDTTNAGASSWALPVRYARTPAETVALSDVTQLEQRLIEWLGGR